MYWNAWAMKVEQIGFDQHMQLTITGYR